MTHKWGQTEGRASTAWGLTLAFFDCCCPDSGSKWRQRSKMGSGSVSLLRCFILWVPLPKLLLPLMCSRLHNCPRVPCFYSFLTQHPLFPPYIFFATFLWEILSAPHTHTHTPCPPCPPWKLGMSLLRSNGADNDRQRRAAPQLWDTRAIWKAGSHWLEHFATLRVCLCESV